MSETTRVTDKGQTTIPKEIREKYGIESGDEVVWEEADEGIVVKKSGALDGYGSFADGLTEKEREELADELEAELYETRRTEWTE
jgi:AbrB family looped-hinge helix DNA binding protein